MAQLLNNELSDQQLVSTALSQPNEYSAIVRRYEAPLARYLRRLGLSRSDDVEDVLQEVFLKVYINLNDYDSAQKFSSWIYRIAHNETVSFFRKANIRPQVATNDNELLMENISDGLDIDIETDQKLLSEKVRLALDKLDDKYKNVLVLKFLEDKSYQEISDIMRIPEGTVATLISRGKKHLKNILISLRADQL